MKVFTTVDLSKEDFEDERADFTQEQLEEILESSSQLIANDVPTQLKITNLPPRSSGFVKASGLNRKLNNIEGGD